MVAHIVYESLKFFKSQISAFIPPISDNLGEVFIIDDEELSRLKACISNLDKDIQNKFFIATYNIQISDFDLKSVNIRVADIQNKTGKIYHTVPVHIRIQGNIITNDVVSALNLLNHLFLYKDTQYLNTVLIDEVEIPIYLYIRSDDFILTAFSNLLKIPYVLDVYSVLFEQIGEGKLIVSVEFDKQI